MDALLFVEEHAKVPARKRVVLHVALVQVPAMLPVKVPVREDVIPPVQAVNPYAALPVILRAQLHVAAVQAVTVVLLMVRKGELLNGNM